MGAAPGVSGWRKSHIAMIAEAEGGAGWLRKWIQLWVQGDITNNVAGLWELGLLVLSLLTAADRSARLFSKHTKMSISCELHLHPCHWLPTSRTRDVRA